MRYPSIPYPGGKARLAHDIVSALPQNGRLFVDPMVGRGNVFFAAATALNYEKWWINDIETAPFFEAVRSIGNSVRIPERSRDEYYRQWKKRGDLRSLILEPYLTWSGGGYGKGGPGGKHSASAFGYRTTIRKCHRLMRTTGVRVTALDLMKMRLEELGGEDTVFFDPPYFNADVRAYSNQFDHAGMLTMLHKAKFRWLLTEYRQDFYVEHFGEPFYQRDVQLAGTNLKLNNGKSRRVECMWKNY